MASTGSMLQEVPRRYAEQLQTTVETMRRRCLSVYDGAFRVGNKSIQLIEKTREVVEPAAYDVKDYVVQAVSNTETLPESDRDLRNNLLELYLGIAVLSIGVSTGIISGATVIGLFLTKFISPLIQLGVLLGAPGYTFYQLKKNNGIDDTERRVMLFGVSYLMGIFFGHFLGARLLSIVPATSFVLPTTLALLVDYEFSPKNLFADRQRLMIAANGIGGILAYLLTYLVAGFAIGPIVGVLAVSALLWVHFQITIAAQKNHELTSTDLQFGYIVALLLTQVIVCVVFGNSQFGLQKF